MRRTSKQLLNFAKTRKWYIVTLIVIFAVFSVGVYAQYTQYLRDSDPFYCEVDSDCKIDIEAEAMKCTPCSLCVMEDYTEDSVIAINKEWVPECRKNVENDDSIMCYACSSGISSRKGYVGVPTCNNNVCTKILVNITR
jgi:hypothetical protein